MIFDTHAHYDDEAYDSDRDTVLSAMPENNVGLIMNSCSRISDMDKILKICGKYPFMYASVGIHPECADEFDENTESEIRRYCADPKVKAVGEIGLDYYYDDVPKSVQRYAFAAQVEIAKSLGKPIVIHSRDAMGDTLDILRAARVAGHKGEFHCYSGSAETAREILSWGWYIAFGGVLTFKNARKTVEAAKYVPLDRIVLETDGPYLTPAPFRGKRNNSIYINYVVDRLAEIKGVSPEEIERITYENGKKLFNIEES